MERDREQEIIASEETTNITDLEERFRGSDAAARVDAFLADPGTGVRMERPRRRIEAAARKRRMWNRLGWLSIITEFFAAAAMFYWGGPHKPHGGLITVGGSIVVIALFAAGMACFRRAK